MTGRRIRPDLTVSEAYGLIGCVEFVLAGDFLEAVSDPAERQAILRAQRKLRDQLRDVPEKLLPRHQRDDDV